MVDLTEQELKGLSLTQAEQEMLDREFRATMDALTGERSLQRFQETYERMY